MKITKENFRTARFTDNERTTIEVMLKLPENPAGELTAFYLQVDETHPDFQDLMKITNIPDIHDYTDAWIKDTREQFKKEVFDLDSTKDLICKLSSKYEDFLNSILHDLTIIRAP